MIQPEVVKVGMADLQVARGSQVLMTSGLGSCVGICLYDASTKVGGMAHIMLPDSKQARNPENKAKFADTAIPELITAMVKLGANRKRLVAKIAGGSQMFAFTGNNDIMRVGERNTEATIKKLREECIPLLANDTGGNYGRTIQFKCEDGSLHIKSIDRGEKVV